MENKKTLFDLLIQLFEDYPSSIEYLVTPRSRISFHVEYDNGLLVPAACIFLPATPEGSGKKGPCLVLIDERGKTQRPPTEKVSLLLMDGIPERNDTAPGVTKNLLPYAELTARQIRFTGPKKHDGIPGIGFAIELTSSKSGYQPLTIDLKQKTQDLFSYYAGLTQMAFKLLQEDGHEWVTAVFAPEGKGHNEWIPTHVNFKEVSLVA